ncbi:MAG: NAD(P)-binding domain-containing protein, partial [Dehalococcoidia bacterium]|nr:NAD(P)-binding domain-containing protein [Dehalococcoidia bacterium]
MKVAFIGTGTMGEAMIKGIIRKKVCNNGNITIYDIRRERVEEIAKKYKVKASPSLDAAVTGGDIVIIAVKPQ